MGGPAGRGGLPPRILRAWQRTDYCVCGAVARIGRHSAAIDALLREMGVRRGTFVSAANPGGRRRPDAWNRRQHDRLLACLRRLPHRVGAGVGRGWSEPHVLIGGDPRRALMLARRFRQAGVVIVGCSRAARVACPSHQGLSCSGQELSRSGLSR
ncbi:MAG TPA: DUF3293 domain-containing protein [Acetobacteraceae bacterium]|nr:DUF3293 domain-containing protein [Acetobacteraceae bacterium]